MRRFLKIHLPNILISALLFGMGSGIGVFVSSLLLKSNLLEPVRDLFAAGRLVAGVTLVILVVGLAGAIGGAMGGLGLAYIRQSAKKWSYTWRTALSFGISYVVILVPLTLYIASLAVYNLSQLSPIRLMIPLAVMGALFGTICGLILGALTVGRDTWRVLLISIFGFSLAGFMFGYGLWSYFFGNANYQGDAWIPIASFIMFGAIGGGALGYIYSWLTHRIAQPRLLPRLIEKLKHLKIYGQIAAIIGLILLFLIIRGIWIISPFSAETAPLGTTLESRTLGTHWADPANIVDQALQPAISVTEGGRVSLAWVHAGDIYVAQLSPDYSSSTPVNVSNSENEATHPQLVNDSDGNFHLVWAERINADASEILYSQCSDTNCTTPLLLSDPANLDCLANPSPQNTAPVIAIDNTNTLMVVWQNEANALLYNTWAANTNSAPTSGGCMPLANKNSVGEPRIKGSADGSFTLVFNQDEEIFMTQYTQETWATSPTLVGTGYGPELLIDSGNQTHLAWCDTENKLTYQAGNNSPERINFPLCAQQRPQLSLDGSGLPRLVWYANEVENIGDVVHPSQLLYEAVRDEGGWLEPRIIAPTTGPAQPALTSESNGSLHLVWSDDLDNNQNLYYTRHTDYDCSGEELSETGQIIYNTIRQEKFRPATDIIPYCHNQFDRLTYTPNPNPAFSNETPTPNGAFDQYVELAKTARYEVVYATMWYEADANKDSPGYVIAEAVADLYKNIKANPSQYPKGLTVRILLDNPPSFALFPTFDNQIRSVMEDLRAAGVPEMSNPEIGWNLEVANFAGSWPHGHTKMMVVDGKTVIGAGYNLQYAHYPKDHVSGKGKDKVDMGIKITGPVAQSSLRAFDDIWEASNRVYCANIDPDSSFWWMFSCRLHPAVAHHVPEVLQYYVPNADSHTFSLHRTMNFSEGDEAYYNAISSAQSTVDTMQVNFSLQAICDLGVLLEVCNFNDRTDPLGAMMNAVENNQARLRILVKETPIDGLENKIAIEAFKVALAEKGLSDYVEIRFFNGDLIHAKATLVDNEWLVVGSQNFHYSAWGEGQALTEYNLVTDDPAATEEFEKVFNYLWEDAIESE